MSPKPLRTKILFLNLMNTFPFLLIFLLATFGTVDSSWNMLSLWLVIFSPTSLATSQDFFAGSSVLSMFLIRLSQAPLFSHSTHSPWDMSFRLVAQMIIHVLMTPNSKPLVQKPFLTSEPYMCFLPLGGSAGTSICSELNLSFPLNCFSSYIPHTTESLPSLSIKPSSKWMWQHTKLGTQALESKDLG